MTDYGPPTEGVTTPPTASLWDEKAQTIQWAPDGALSGVPSEVMHLLADDGRTFGYGYGPGWSVIFGSRRGEVALRPGQWVTRYSDGRIEVTDEKPDLRLPPASTPEEGTS